MKSLARSITLVGSVLALAAFAPAFADNIVVNQWYTAQFGITVPSAVSGPGVDLGTDAPLPGGGTETAVFAPSGTSWTITLASAGYLVVTDVEDSGDQFAVSVNGTAATPTGDYLGGQRGLATGWTSVPVPNAAFDSEDVKGSLSNADFSSGTFYLPAGTDTISFLYEGSIGAGDMDFFVGTPEPSGIALMLTIMAAIGFVVARKRRTAAQQS